MDQQLKNTPTMQESRAWSLGWEDPLEEEMAAHSSILAWKIPWTAESGGLQCMGLQRFGHDWPLSLITADDDSCHEIKRCLLLGKKVIPNLDSILKSRDITLPAKVHLVKAMVFPVVMYGCESWTIKKELILLNCGVGEESWESLGLQGDPASPS